MLPYPVTILHTKPCKRLYSQRPTVQPDPNEPWTNDDDAFLQDVTSVDDFYAAPDQFPTFESLGIQSPILLQRVHNMLNGNTSRPSAVQAASFSAITSGKDVSIGAETGSGKTLAYLLPLIDDILTRKQRGVGSTNHKSSTDDEMGGRLGYDYARAVILVPNKELANQVLRMAMDLCGGPRSVVWGSDGETVTTAWNVSVNQDEEEEEEECDIVRLGILPGGLKSPEDYKPIRMAINDPMNYAPLDIIITTPASLGPIGVNPKNINMFADIETVVIDEADMLLDGGVFASIERCFVGIQESR
jgi:Superfamily II DNA and RNA helicases